MRSAVLLLLAAGCATTPAPDSPPPQAPEVTPVPVASADPAPTVTPRRGWLGIELEPSRAGKGGVAVTAVVPGSPAEQAGIIPGDVILLLDGRAVTAPEQVLEIVGTHATGERVSVALRRGTRDRLLGVLLAPRPDEDGVQRMRYVGSPAPTLQGLMAVQGSIDTAALRGKVVLIEFWSPWCTGCQMLVPQMNAWHSQLTAQGLAVLGITTESVAVATQAAQQLGMSYPLLSDESGDTTRAYRALAVPALFLVDRRGLVRDVMVGYSGPRVSEMGTLLDRLLAEP